MNNIIPFSSLILSNQTYSDYITDINFITDYIYISAYSKIYSKCNYNGYIYLNPYLRALWIIKISKQYINKIKSYKFINTNYKPTTFTNQKDMKFYNNAKSCVESLIKFDGNIQISKIEYNNVELDDDIYDYSIISKLYKYMFGKMYESKNIRLHMFNDHVYFNKFVATVYNLFYNLQFDQMQITIKEEQIIKQYIKQILLKHQDKSSTSTNYLLPSSLINDLIQSDVVNNFTFIDIYNISNKLQFQHTLKPINVFKFDDNTIITIKDVLDAITNIYPVILNINPISVDFKLAMNHSYDDDLFVYDYFDIIHTYDVYKNIYSKL